ncbi:hypothetical protein ACROYT_G031504 [Oculina patagonica]
MIGHLPPFIKTFNFARGMQLFQAKPFLILSFAFCVLRQVQGQLTAKGCYQDKEHDRALPELLHSYRGGMNWRDLRGTVIENCKKEAVKKGYECFGIQFYGECWSGEDACDVDNYAVHGELRVPVKETSSQRQANRSIEEKDVVQFLEGDAFVN